MLRPVETLFIDKVGCEEQGLGYVPCNGTTLGLLDGLKSAGLDLLGFVLELSLMMARGL